MILAAFAIILTGNAAGFHAEAKNSENRNYCTIRGGIYSPGREFDITDFNSGTRSHFDLRRGFIGEIALGRHVVPEMAIQLETGYFETDSPPAAGPGLMRVSVVPVLFTAKGFIPLGSISIYGEFGGGAYLTEIEATGNTGSIKDESTAEYGLHAGFGFDIDFSDTFFVGAGERFFQLKPVYGGQHVNLSGFTTAVGLGFRF